MKEFFVAEAWGPGARRIADVVTFAIFCAAYCYFYIFLIYMCSLVTRLRSVGLQVDIVGLHSPVGALYTQWNAARKPSSTCASKSPLPR